MQTQKAQTLNGRAKMLIQPVEAPTLAPMEWSEIVDITPALAAEWLKTYHFNGQRPVRPGNVERLAREMIAGRFKTSEFRLVHVGAEAFLTNGQHRLHAVIQTGITIRGNVYHQIGASREVAAEDYGDADNIKMRTIPERLAPHDTAERLGLTPTNLNILSGSTGPIIGGFTRTSFTLAQIPLAVRIRFMEDYGAEARFYFDVLHGAAKSQQRAMRGRGVMAVALVTLRECGPRAMHFWQSVAENDGLHKGDPQHSLVRLLLSDESRSRRNVVQLSRLVASLWNSYCRGDKNHAPKARDLALPIFIAGSHNYDGQGIYLPYGGAE